MQRSYTHCCFRAWSWKRNVTGLQNLKMRRVMRREARGEELVQISVK
jgi:hypothetical protein